MHSAYCPDIEDRLGTSRLSAPLGNSFLKFQPECRTQFGANNYD